MLAVSYFFTPSSVIRLNEKINQSNPKEFNAARENLYKEYSNYLASHLPQKNPQLYFYWYSNQKKISDLRVKKAISEIKNSKLNNNETKIWSLLNMGVVIKTGGNTIAIDTANIPFSNSHNELASITDIFIATHMDGDHYDSTLLKKALTNGKKVVFLEGMSLYSNNKNEISLKSGETADIDGIKITAYQTDHRGDGNFNEPCAWFIIETNGIKILHTGDGREFKNKVEYQKVYAMKDFDMLLANYQLHPYNIRDLSPNVLIPLHLFKFMSGYDLFQESTFETVSKNYEKYSSEMTGIEKIFLLPGESYTYLK